MDAPAFLNVLLVQDGLTFRDIIDSLPTDPASLIALLLVVGFFGLIVYFGKKGAGQGDVAGSGQKPEERPPAEEDAAGRPLP